MNKKIKTFFSKQDRGSVSYVLLVYAFTVLTAGGGVLGALQKIGAGDITKDALAKYRAAVAISENPGPHTDPELNAAIKQFQAALSRAVQDTPNAPESLKQFVAFIPQDGRATQNTSSLSDSFPLTLFNQTDTTGRECGVPAVTLTGKVDGKNVGTFAPGKSVTTRVSKGTHRIQACGKAPWNCIEGDVPVPKYTFVYFYWGCRQSLNPMDPVPAFEPVLELGGISVGMLEVAFSAPPEIK